MTEGETASALHTILRNSDTLPKTVLYRWICSTSRVGSMTYAYRCCQRFVQKYTEKHHIRCATYELPATYLIRDALVKWAHQ